MAGVLAAQRKPSMKSDIPMRLLRTGAKAHRIKVFVDLRRLNAQP